MLINRNNKYQHAYTVQDKAVHESAKGACIRFQNSLKLKSNWRAQSGVAEDASLLETLQILQKEL